MGVFVVLLVGLIAFKIIYAYPVGSTPGLPIPPPEIIKFMRTFGYLDHGPPDSEALYHESAIVDAIKNVQKYGALNQTGILDNETLKLMRSPRCGVPDIGSGHESEYDDNGPERRRRRRRYIIGAKSWMKRKITYFIANWSPKVGEQKVAAHMAKAFDTWAQYGNLKFKRVYDPSADIIVAFGTRHHGDGYPFDGPGNILAHAFYPYEMQSFGGDIHFDDDENWKENATDLAEGVDFLSVAVHELGHSLGLAHSPVYASIMFPYYKGPSGNTLDFDDILAMYELYIKAVLEEGEDFAEEDEFDQNTPYNPPFYPTLPPPPTTTTMPTFTFDGDYESVDDHQKKSGEITTPRTHVETTTAGHESVNICEGNFDAVSLFRGDIFIFKGNYIWRLTRQYRIVEGYPVQLAQMFPFLPDSVKSVDAVYERKTDNSIILFTGRYYWVYNGHSLIENSPRSISDFGIDENVERIDAALMWPKNQLTYLFAGDQFWRFDEDLQQLDEGYPMNMTRWNGLPSNIDAATPVANGKTYFFKDNLYWLYNNKRIRPARGYPRNASNSWLGCSLRGPESIRKSQSVQRSTSARQPGRFRG